MLLKGEWAGRGGGGGIENWWLAVVARGSKKMGMVRVTNSIGLSGLAFSGQGQEDEDMI